MTGKATARRATGSRRTTRALEHFFLESNFATDKKSSQVNMLRTRGKRVVAEATIPRDLIKEHMHADVRACSSRARPGVEPRRLHVGREQQRRPLGQRHHGDLHRHRPGRGERRGVLGGVRLRRAAAERRLLRLDHDPVADRRHLRRRHRPGHPARVPRDARLLRRGQGAQARRDRGRDRAVRRALARARRSSPRSGWRRTTCSAATGRRAGHDNHTVADAVGELERGRDIYASEAWVDAYESLSAADRSEPLGADDLELLATSAYMLGREEDYLGSSSAPTAPTLTAGRAAGARCGARSGSGVTLAARGEMGRAGGWLGRAQRLLDRAGGRLRRARLPAAARSSSSRRRGGDWEAAAATAAEAAAIGERFGDPDLFALAAHEQGHVLIQDGRAQGGPRRCSTRRWWR